MTCVLLMRMHVDACAIPASDRCIGLCRAHAQPWNGSWSFHCLCWPSCQSLPHFCFPGSDRWATLPFPQIGHPCGTARACAYLPSSGFSQSPKVPDWPQSGSAHPCLCLSFAQDTSPGGPMRPLARLSCVTMEISQAFLHQGVFKSPQLV